MERHPDGGPVHGGEGDPLGEGVEELTEQGKDDGTENQPPLPDDEPKPGL